MTASNLRISKCVRCGCDIEYEPVVFGDLTFPPPNICDACEPIIEKEHAEERLAEYRREREKEFRGLCPEPMRTINPDKLPCGAEKLEQCVNHDLDMGLVIHGVTGMGKTRLMWQLAKRVFVSEMKSVRVLRSSSFGRMIERSYAEGMGKHDELIERLSRVSFLFIDDLGKAKLTERVETDLFDIIDARYAAEKPCIFTTQFVGESLAERFSTIETGEAVVRRIRETCKSLSLTKPEDPQQHML